MRETEVQTVAEIRKKVGIYF